MKAKKEIKTDKEAEDFVDQVDLSTYDFSSFEKVNFEFQKKEARVNMRMPVQLLAKIKEMAKSKGIPYTRFIREVLEQKVA